MLPTELHWLGSGWLIAGFKLQEYIKAFKTKAQVCQGSQGKEWINWKKNKKKYMTNKPRQKNQRTNKLRGKLIFRTNTVRWQKLRVLSNKTIYYFAPLGFGIAEYNHRPIIEIKKSRTGGFCPRKWTQIPENEVHCSGFVLKSYGMYVIEQTYTQRLNKDRVTLIPIFWKRTLEIKWNSVNWVFRSYHSWPCIDNQVTVQCVGLVTDNQVMVQCAGLVTGIK